MEVKRREKKKKERKKIEQQQRENTRDRSGTTMRNATRITIGRMAYSEDRGTIQVTGGIRRMAEKGLDPRKWSGRWGRRERLNQVDLNRAELNRTDVWVARMRVGVWPANYLNWREFHPCWHVLKSRGCRLVTAQRRHDSIRGWAVLYFWGWPKTSLVVDALPARPRC